VKGELVASSLVDMLMVQLVLQEADINTAAVSSVRLSFRCIRAQVGLRKYCSDACRMRAYRIREASKTKGLKCQGQHHTPRKVIVAHQIRLARARTASGNITFETRRGTKADACHTAKRLNEFAEGRHVNRSAKH
jgi:hypothetical protein